MAIRHRHAKRGSIAYCLLSEREAPDAVPMDRPVGLILT